MELIVAHWSHLGENFPFWPLLPKTENIYPVPVCFDGVFKRSLLNVKFKKFPLCRVIHTKKTRIKYSFAHEFFIRFNRDFVSSLDWWVIFSAGLVTKVCVKTARFRFFLLRNFLSCRTLWVPRLCRSSLACEQKPLSLRSIIKEILLEPCPCRKILYKRQTKKWNWNSV